MAIIPAIDIINGEVVRLAQGDYGRKTVYGKSPLEQALAFQEQGFTRLHVVDLDGAKAGRPMNTNIIKGLAQKTRLKVQVGGGLRTHEDIEKLFIAGVSKVVIGSMALEKPEILQAWVKKFGSGKIIAAVDVKNGRVAYAGWQKYISPTSLREVGRDRSLRDCFVAYAPRNDVRMMVENMKKVVKQMISMGIEEIIVTDISRDGMLEGPNVALYEMLVKQFPEVDFIASGGVRGEADIEMLAKAGISKVIIGRALLKN